MVRLILLNDKGFEWKRGKSVQFKGVVWLNGRKLTEPAEVEDVIDPQDETSVRNFAQNANGFFVLVISSKRATYLVSDRVRTFPLFFVKTKDGFVVSDHAPALLRWTRCEVEARKKAEFLLTGYVTHSETLVEPIVPLQAGEIVKLEGKNISRTPYFRYIYRPFYDEQPDRLFELLDQLFLNATKRLIDFVDGRTIVLPLSGGMDSRTILFYLKELGFKDVITFSYGREGNRESQISKNVAEDYGYKWLFVPYSESSWFKWYNSEQLWDYFAYSGNLISTPHIQDFPAVWTLKSSGQIPADAVFVPGHTLDFLSGGHIPPYWQCDSFFTIKKVLHGIWRKHFKLNTSRTVLSYKDVIFQKIRKVIAEELFDKDILNFIEAANAAEYWDWKERQPKYILNSLRVYEFWGYKWYVPLWDAELIDFWLRVHPCLKIRRRLFKEFAFKRGIISQRLPIAVPSKNAFQKTLLTIWEIWKALDPSIKYLKFFLWDRHKDPLAWNGIWHWRKFLRHRVRENMSMVACDYLEFWELKFKEWC